MKPMKLPMLPMWANTVCIEANSAEVGAVGHHDTETDRQGEEHLPGGVFEHAAEANFRIAEHGEVGAEHELVALGRAGLAGDVEDDEHEQAEQRRHALRQAAVGAHGALAAAQCLYL